MWNERRGARSSSACDNGVAVFGPVFRSLATVGCDQLVAVLVGKRLIQFVRRRLLRQACIPPAKRFGQRRRVEDCYQRRQRRSWCPCPGATPSSLPNVSTAETADGRSEGRVSLRQLAPLRSSAQHQKHRHAAPHAGLAMAGRGCPRAARAAALVPPPPIVLPSVPSVPSSASRIQASGASGSSRIISTMARKRPIVP